MSERQGTQVCDSLQREGNKLAFLAASSFEEAWMPRFPVPVLPPPPDQLSFETQLDIGYRTRPVPRLGELTAMLRDGYVRLGSVIALSVLVDEPGLIADDILWLLRMFGARNIALTTDNWVAELLNNYADACAAILPEELCVPIHSSIERALKLINNAKPV